MKIIPRLTAIAIIAKRSGRIEALADFFAIAATLPSSLISHLGVPPALPEVFQTERKLARHHEFRV